MQKGIIIKALSGFYYVHSDGVIYECKARGIFRKNELSPLVGDKVEINITDENKGVIESITPRSNFLVRPPVANIDRLFVIVSTVDPSPNTTVIDKVIADAENRNIEPIIVINKCDIELDDELYNIYSSSGFITLRVSAASKEGIEQLGPLIKDNVCAFTGNSGVGKSSILNSIDENMNLATGITSKKLGRGKHTTRHVELFGCCGGYIADTPGFSSFDMERCDMIRKENLQYCFREFEPYLLTCKFTSCSHTKEKGCSIIEAVNNGKISKSRFDSYVKFYQDAATIPDWEFDKMTKH